MNPKHPPGPPMTLGNMRAPGVRGVDVCSYGGGEFAIHSPTDWAAAISS